MDARWTKPVKTRGWVSPFLWQYTGMKTTNDLTPTARPVGLFGKPLRAGQRQRMSLNEMLDYAIMTLMVAIALVLAAPLGVVMLWQTRMPAVQAPAKPFVKPLSEQRNVPLKPPFHSERLTLV